MAPPPIAPPVAEASAAPPASSPRRLPLLALTLWSFIAIGIACRFVGLFSWDEGTHLHPDERFLTMVVPALQWPHSLAEYFWTQTAPLNPYNHSLSGRDNINFFVYGQLPLLLAKITAVVLQPLVNRFSATPLQLDSYDGILLVGRALSALFDAGTVLLAVLIGRRIAGREVGLLAGALTACIALHIQQSHFFVVDTFTAFFVTAAFLCLMKWYDALPGFSRRWALLAGVCWGAAMACKISAALLAALVVPLLVIGWTQHRTAPGAVRRMAWSGVLIFAAACISFRVAHPIAFAGTPGPLTLGGLLDVRPTMQGGEVDRSPFLQRLAGTGVLAVQPTPEFWSATLEQERITSGESERVWDWQWIGRRNYLWPLRNLALWAVGWPLIVAGAGGMLLLLTRTARRRPVPMGMAAAAWWALFVFVYHARLFSKFSRYYLIGTPFLALCAAYLLWEVWQRAQSASAGSPSTARAIRVGGASHPQEALAALAVCSVLGLTALWAVACTSIYTRPHPRLEASRWIRANIAPGTPVLNETPWDDSLPNGDTGGLRMSSLELYDNDNETKRQHMLDMLDQGAWIFVSSQRAWQSIPRAPQRWPLTTEYYRALFTGQLGFVPVQQFASYPQLHVFGLHLEFPDDTVEEALSVYDHPRVVLFQKTASWSRERAARLLSPDLLARVQNVSMADIRDSGWRPDENPLPWLPSPRP